MLSEPLEVSHVSNLVDMPVGVEILIANSNLFHHGKVFQGGPFFRVSSVAASTIRGGRSGLMRTMEKFEELLEQGETLAEEGLLEDALSRFEQALALEPENPEVIEAIGRALLGLDRTEEAEASFLDALEFDPDWVAPRMGLATLAMRNDEPFKAIHHLERATALDPEYPDAFVELGRYYGLMGEPSLAHATFERWIRQHPEDADMLINAGLTAFAAAAYVRPLQA